MDTFTLAPHVVFEPLVNRWHATWNTVSPLTSMLDVVKHQIPALTHYLTHPEKHYEGAHKLKGSAYVDVPPERREEVAELVRRAGEDYRGEIDLVNELRAFEGWLLQNATGEALSAAYARVPSALVPYVELVYDYHARPSVRVDQGLLYRSRHYRRDMQTTSVFFLEKDTDRTFQSSTPRLPSQDHVALTKPWSDPAWSAIFDLDLTPASFDEALARFAAVGLHDRDKVSALLVPAAPRAKENAPKSDALQVQFVGHATALFRYKGQSVLIDPVVSALPRGGGAARATFRDLPSHIDVVAITHAHTDHFELETLWRLRSRVGTLVVPKSSGISWADVSLRHVAEQMGYRRVVEVAPGDAIPLDGGEVVAGPFWGEHGDVAHTNKCTYALRFGETILLMLVDAQGLPVEGYAEFMKGIGTPHSLWLNTELVGAPISWQFDAVFPEQRDRKKERTRRCRGANVEEALGLAEHLRPRALYNYAMGVEPWLGWVLGEVSDDSSDRIIESTRMIGLARERGVDARRLQAGETFTLP